MGSGDRDERHQLVTAETSGAMGALPQNRRDLSQILIGGAGGHGCPRSFQVCDREVLGLPKQTRQRLLAGSGGVVRGMGTEVGARERPTVGSRREHVLQDAALLVRLVGTRERLVGQGLVVQTGDRGSTGLVSAGFQEIVHDW